MATKNKIGSQFEGFEELTEKLQSLEGDLKKVTENALIESKKIVTDELKKVTIKPNFPAKGIYSKGGIASSIDSNLEVEWQGSTATIHVGYDFDKTGIKQIALIRGTPKMKKSTKIYNALYGSAIKKRIAKVQEDIFQKAIEERMK